MAKIATPVPTARTVTITPEKARELLSRNHGNRAIRATNVDYLTRQIADGRWHLTNDAIAVARSGRLLNGQHRLTAIASGKRSVPCLLLEDLDEAAYIAMDIGSRRNMSDVTGLPPGLVADVQLLLCLAADGQKRTRISPEEVVDFSDAWRPAFDALAAVKGAYSRKGMNNSMLRIAVGLRWAVETSPQRRQHVLDQYGALLQADMDRACKATRALFRRLGLGQIPKAGAQDARVRTSVIYWVHFDPERADVDPQVRDFDAEREVLRFYGRALPEAYAAGDKRHPYHFSSRPKVERFLSGAAATKRAARTEVRSHA